MTRALEDTVWHLIQDALELYRDEPRATAWLRGQLDRFAEPLRIGLAGPAGSGRSTLLNALVGERVAPIAPPDGPPVLACYRHGPRVRVSGFGAAGPVPDAPVTRTDDELRVDVSAWRAYDVDEVLVDLPTRALRHAMFIDTPPVLDAPDGDGGPDRLPGRLARVTDALIYLVRAVPGPDLEALRAVQSSAVARASAVNTVVVLSRADELGGGRLDAVPAATQVARGYRRDPAVREVCQSIVAVSGLLAQAARTLRADDFAALRDLAAAPRTDLAALLLSVDRFTTPDTPVPLGVAARRELLDRWGLHGVRVATTLIRAGAGTPDALTAQLVKHSGLAELRASVSQFLIGRHGVLKARSALLGLELVLRMRPGPGTRQLTAELERVVANAHDFRELRLLAALRTGRVRLPGRLDAEAQRLVGGEGTGVAARLGPGEPFSGAHVRRALRASLERWQALAANPVLGPAQRRAAEVVVRSCEEMLVGASTEVPAAA